MTYVALRMLFGDRVKFLTLVVGLTFSVLLITQQGSIFMGLMRRFTTNITNASVPIWVSDPSIRFIDDVKPLNETDLARVRSVPGVDWAVPFVQRLTQVQLPQGRNENIYLLGVDAETLVGLPHISRLVAGHFEDLDMPDAVIVDQRGLKKLGSPGLGDTFEINDRRARIVGIVNVMSGFQSLPYVYTTYDRAKLYLPPQRKVLSYIFAKAAPGLTDAEVSRRIEALTGLGAYPEPAFIWKTSDYFLKNTGIPINFGITVALGVVVGAAIAAQTFYTFTLENIRQFATLKAMGAGNFTLMRMILLQSFLVGMIGYGIGLGLLSVFGNTVPGNSELAFFTPWQLLILAFVAVVGVCMFSAVFSMWRVFRVDPALVFRG
jgi:putative ABC transport system permease protein